MSLPEDSAVAVAADNGAPITVPPDWPLRIEGRIGTLEGKVDTLIDMHQPKGNGPALIAASKDVTLAIINALREVAPTKTGVVMALALLAAVTVGGSQVISVGLEGLTIMPATMQNKRAAVEHRYSPPVLPDAGP